MYEKREGGGGGGGGDLFVVVREGWGGRLMGTQLRVPFGDVHLPLSWFRSRPTRLGPCGFLRVIANQKIHRFFFFSRFFFFFFGEQRKKLLKQPVKSRHGPARSHHFSENAWQMGNMCALMAPNLFIISLFWIRLVIAGSWEAFTVH